MKEFRDGPLADEMMGEAWPAVQPGADPVLYGYAELRPNDPVEVRSLQTFELVYTVGRYGLDDTGSIRVSFRSLGDWGSLQMDDPAGYNYVTAHSSKGVPIRLSYVSHGAPRPRWKALTAHVMGGFLREGDSIHITFGDTSGGSPGMRMQTMVEMDFQFRVLADVCAVGHHVPIPESPAISVVPGPPVCWRAVLPSLRRPGETVPVRPEGGGRLGQPDGPGERAVHAGLHHAGIRTAGRSGLSARPQVESASRAFR